MELMTEDENINLGRFFELAAGDKFYFNWLNSQELKEENLEIYTGDFEMIVVNEAK